MLYIIYVCVCMCVCDFKNFTVKLIQLIRTIYKVAKLNQLSKQSLALTKGLKETTSNNIKYLWDHASKASEERK